MLQLRKVDSYYGNIRALHEVSLDVAEGSIVAIIGPNGSGKSTTVRTISALNPARSGTITYRGAPIEGLRPDEIVRRGIALVPQGRQLFLGLSVQENLDMGAYIRTDRAAVREDVERMFSIFPVLAERRGQEAATLSGGEQQMLAIARALMSRPRLLLLDEPSLGIAPILVRQIFEAIREINERDGMTILLVEQNAYHALRLAHRGYVLVNGAVTMTGGGRELLARPEVRAAYLEAGGGVTAEA